MQILNRREGGDGGNEKRLELPQRGRLHGCRSDDDQDLDSDSDLALMILLKSMLILSRTCCSSYP